MRVQAFIPISENAQHSTLSSESSELDVERYAVASDCKGFSRATIPHTPPDKARTARRDSPAHSSSSQPYRQMPIADTWGPVDQQDLSPAPQCRSLRPGWRQIAFLEPEGLLERPSPILPPPLEGARVAQ